MKQVYFLLVVVIMGFSVAAMAGDSAMPPATADAYYDVATGHKYIRNPDATYTEYSKRGKLLRSNVSNTMPLLVSGRYIVEVMPEHYLVYERTDDNGIAQKVLPATSQHPEGWRCIQMVSTVQRAELSTAEAYSSPE